MTILFNPALTDERKQEIERLLLEKEFAEPHFWISTSGSFAKEGVSKWAALSHKALIASGLAVNAHLEANSSDVWLNPLPLFHVGGLGIKFRAELSGAKKVDFSHKWSCDLFMDALHDSKATLTALVPTQLYDLVVKEHRAPSPLRALIIGGGSLDEALYLKARTLGWNILPSYGMTEAASQVATAPLSSLNKQNYPALQLLEHIQASAEGGVLQIKSPSLFTTYGIIENGRATFHDPKQNGIFTTSDRGEVAGRNLTILGRVDDVVKVLGENVDISKLQKLIDSLKLDLSLKEDFYIAPVLDPRTGSALCLYTTASDEEAAKLAGLFNQKVFPFERITLIKKRELLPKTALGKIERKKLESI